MGRPAIFTDRERALKIKLKSARQYRENKEEIAKKSAARYAADPKKFNARSKRYAIDNPDKRRAQGAAWIAANKERDKAARKARAQRTRIQRNEAAARWREKHPERAKATYAKFRDAHPEIVRANGAARRARKAKATIGNPALITAWEKSWKSKRTATCYWCRGRVATKGCHTDHVVALAKGGAHAIDNLCISCTPCNLSKGAKPITAWNTRIAQPVLL